MPSSDENACPVCSWQLTRAPRSAGEVVIYECLRCGDFVFDMEAREDLPAMMHTPRQRAVLSHSIRRAQQGGRPRYSSSQIERILQNAFLPTAHEQADNVIRWLGNSVDGPGEISKVNGRDHGAIAGSLLGVENFIFLIKEMRKSGLVDGDIYAWSENKSTPSHAEGMARVTLSFEGWSRYEELKRGAASGSIAFMAMQYGSPELDGIVDTCFRPAVAQAGFVLRRLDDQPRAGLIDDRLRIEIKACRLLIADLTHGNRGAYWEAGYAEGLSKPVIYTCRADVFDNRQATPDTYPHFDTNHHLTVPWHPDRIEEAAQKLIATIRATMPEARQQD